MDSWVARQFKRGSEANCGCGEAGRYTGPRLLRFPSATSRRAAVGNSVHACGHLGLEATVSAVISHVRTASSSP